MHSLICYQILSVHRRGNELGVVNFTAAICVDFLDDQAHLLLRDLAFKMQILNNVPKVT